MADTKISALTSSTTPLAGTEVLPIVQSGATVKVAVSNLTAGRDTSVKKLLTTDNVGVGTSTPTAITGTARVLDVVGTTYGFGLFGDGVVTGQIVGDGANSKVLIGSRTNHQVDVIVNNAAVWNYTTTGNLVPAGAAKGVNFTANTPAAGMTSQLLNWYEEGTWTPTSFDITYAAATGSYTRIGRQVFAHFSITLPTTSDANNITIVGLPFTVANTDQMRTGAIGYTDYGTACTLAPVKNTTRGNIFKFDGVPVTNANASGKVFAGVFIYNV